MYFFRIPWPWLIRHQCLSVKFSCIFARSCKSSPLCNGIHRVGDIFAFFSRPIKHRVAISYLKCSDWRQSVEAMICEHTGPTSSNSPQERYEGWNYSRKRVLGANIQQARQINEYICRLTCGMDILQMWPQILLVNNMTDFLLSQNKQNVVKEEPLRSVKWVCKVEGTLGARGACVKKGSSDL